MTTYSLIRYFAAALASGLLISGCKSYDDGIMDDLPYKIEISGLVMDTGVGPRPAEMEGVTVNLISYDSQDPPAAVGKASAVSAKDGSFTIFWTESGSGSSHILSTEEFTRNGITYSPFELSINLLSDSPSYDKESGCFRLTDIAVALKRK